jgi:maltooligosyltrehalose trehalohydrolase
MTAFWLLAPGTPMLFQGQEFSASAPFLYFADFAGDLAAAIRKGRAEFLEQFPSILLIAESGALADPADPETFHRSKLDLTERDRHPEAVALHRDLLRLRRERAAFRRQAPGGVDGAVLSPQTFFLRFFAEAPTDERLLLVNLGPALLRSSIADPLAAPPVNRPWVVEWSSEDVMYGGDGGAELRQDGPWIIGAERAWVLAPGPECERRRAPARKRRTA